MTETPTGSFHPIKEPTPAQIPQQNPPPSPTLAVSVLEQKNKTSVAKKEVWINSNLKNLFESLQRLADRVRKYYTHAQVHDATKLRYFFLAIETLQVYAFLLNEFEISATRSLREEEPTTMAKGNRKRRRTTKKGRRRTLKKQHRGGIVGWFLNRVVSARKKEIRDLSNKLATQGCIDKTLHHLLDRCQGSRFERNLQTRRTCSISRLAYRKATKKLGVVALDVCDAAFLTFQEQKIALLDELRTLSSQPRFARLSDLDDDISVLVRLRELLMQINQRNYSGFLSDLENVKNQLWVLVHAIQPELEKITF